MRVTQNQIMRQYSDRIGNVLSELDKASKRVMTGLRYSRSYESPVNASRAARLYDQKLDAERYISNIKDTLSIYDNMEDNLSEILNAMGDIARMDIKQALSDTNASERDIFANTLRTMQKTLVTNLNQSFGNQQMFGGSSTVDAPFALADDGITLTYRGIDVNDPANEAVLKELANESIYIDIGFGLKVDNAGVVDPSTAFNRALSGLLFTGYGVDEDGDPKNFISTLGIIADELTKENFDREKISRLWEKFEFAQFDNVNKNISILGSNYNFLESHQARLESNQFRLEEKIDSLIGIDPSEAITQWEYQQYVYNAVLKMGTSLLSPSFIDFMK